MAINFNYDYPQVAREAGFKLRQFKDGPIDWRILGSMEIERLVQDQRLEQVDAILGHLSEAPVATMLDTNILDSGIAKYFVVSQFAIQYLLFCRKFLDETIRELREAHADSQRDVAKLRKSLVEANNEILQLHKKMTQIEAIHEVVYPCHLCTKSFISNEALNIHISRRHATHVSNNTTVLGKPVGGYENSTAERRADTTVSGVVKERENNDLQLINAIKLELEIKQLKERLNNAERDIRERSIAASNSRRTTPREPPKNVKSIAIQSDLLETKEQDDEANMTLDSNSTDNSEVRERKAQLTKLQMKIQEFEEWRVAQQTNNKDSIAEINRKLSEIVQTLEDVKSQPTTTNVITVAPKAEAECNDIEAPPARNGSPSVEDLERLLTEKVVEIGQKSAEKLEEFVQNMETNYKEKLEELEREIKKRNAAELPKANEIKPATETVNSAEEKTINQTTTTADIHVLPRDITYTAFNPTESDSSINVEQKPEPVKRMPRIKRSMNVVTELNANDKTKKDDETFSIDKKEKQTTALKPKPRVRQNKSVESTTSHEKNIPGAELYSLSTESNRTFVKPDEGAVTIHTKDGNDSTDITESLSSESESEASSSTKTEVIQHSSTETVKALQKSKLADLKIPKNLQKPKVFSRIDAQKMVNKRLTVLGLEPKENSISTAAMKRLHTELSDKRHKLKQKYPNFYATRNKIKKLVDKLCSTKLPTPVENIQRHTKPIQPKTTFDVSTHREHEDEHVSSEMDGFETLELTSTPIQNQTTQSLREKDAFKERLERILSSPMRQPAVDVSGVDPGKLSTAQMPIVAPVPLTRKRVMFNTLKQSSNASVDYSKQFSK
ncbi:zinc finger protein DZIP1L [Ceratitis capitata]|uniref:zinc finger protein DZIP1L n=1 Tax=Ceratitis capitata TaxID=7213 RepID=UPI0006188B89|nr:zinc finger protein DZIP1L [Ceratitis capitata]